MIIIKKIITENSEILFIVLSLSLSPFCSYIPFSILWFFLLVFALVFASIQSQPNFFTFQSNEQSKHQGYWAVFGQAWTSWRVTNRRLSWSLYQSSCQRWYQSTSLSRLFRGYGELRTTLDFSPIWKVAHLLLLVWPPKPWRERLQDLDWQWQHSE